jgi:Phage minor capsid protein 2.
MADYDIGKAFAKIEYEIMASMIRNMKRHRIEEIDEKKQWSMWQAEQLKALERFKRENREKYEAQFKEINSAIDSAIREAKAQGGMEQEIKILEAIKKGYKPKKPQKSAQTSGEFFKLNERKLEALIKATTKDMEKAETAVLRRADDQYRKIIFDAQAYANTGAGTYEKAVDMAVKDFLSRGINCIEYANGARHTIAAYADMAVQTAAKRAYLQGEGEMRREWGISTVIINKRSKACPLCLPFAGKVMIDDVWSGGSGRDGPYPLLSAAITKGLYHPNCRDAHTTYFEGISTPPDSTFTREELKDLKKGYREEQRKRYAQRQADKFGRLAEFSLDAENKEKYKIKKEAWEKELAKYGKSGKIKSEELFRRTQTPRSGMKFISDEMFDRLTIAAKKKGAVILRGTKEVEEHLDKMGAAASNIGEILMFRKDVCISEVLEETHHFEQNLMKLNSEKGEPLRTILNEIDAKRHILENAGKYKVPRNEIELTEKQLKSYEGQLKTYKEQGGETWEKL